MAEDQANQYHITILEDILMTLTLCVEDAPNTAMGIVHNRDSSRHELRIRRHVTNQPTEVLWVLIEGARIIVDADFAAGGSFSLADPDYHYRVLAAMLKADIVDLKEPTFETFLPVDSMHLGWRPVAVFRNDAILKIYFGLRRIGYEYNPPRLRRSYSFRSPSNEDTKLEMIRST